MNIISDPINLQQELLWLKKNGKRIALVPTMGNLHQGHLSLVDIAKQHADIVVASIFVNPMQFGPNEDFANYPRTLQEDATKLRQQGVHFLFTPQDDAIYPLGKELHTCVEVNRMTDKLCGHSRPGHFRGVTSVVNILFNIVQPDVAVFGKKDYQQLLLIKAMVADLFLPIEIIGGEIVREPNGLAMSSRNGYLSTQEKEQASQLRKTILETAAKIETGERDYAALCQQAIERLASNGFKTDYFEILNRHQLSTAESQDRQLLIVAAAWMGKPKLLDNMEVDRPE